MKTTFQTPFGRYRFLRMPYGIKTAPEIFHRLYCEIFKDIPNIAIYIDDITVWAEHNKILATVFERAKQFGVKFNLEKYQFNCKKVKFLGHLFTEHGIEVDDSKVEAIRKFEKPKDPKAKIRNFKVY